MGECGCSIEVQRCSAHAGDVVLVLEHAEAVALKLRCRGVTRAADNATLSRIAGYIDRGGVPRPGRDA